MLEKEQYANNTEKDGKVRSVVDALSYINRGSSCPSTNVVAVSLIDFTLT